MSSACTSRSITRSPRTCRAKNEINSRYSAPARLGMPIKKMSRTGISPKGIGFEHVAMTMTMEERQSIRACGNAIPPGNKDRSVCCRSKTAADNFCQSCTSACPCSLTSILEMASYSETASKFLTKIAARRCSTAFRLITPSLRPSLSSVHVLFVLYYEPSE
jgi:hypothetical protein